MYKKGYALVEFVKPESVNDCVNIFNLLKLYETPIYIYPFIKEAEYLNKY